MFNQFLRTVGPIALAALAAKAAQEAREGKSRSGPKRRAKVKIDGVDLGAFQFDRGRFNFGNGMDGKRLEDLDLTQDAPEKVVILGPDTVRITAGKTFRIKVSGDNADDVRFSLKDGRLAVMRTRGQGSETIVDVTMPPPRALVIAGSGKIEASDIAKKAKLTIAGSGALKLDGISAKRAKINVLGSGRLHASGKIKRLHLNIAGSGLAQMEGLNVKSARVVVAGSGSASFASDGKVEAKMMGSGHVTVHGSAECTVHSMGSGKLNVVPRDSDDGEPEAPTPPEPPKPPKSGGAAEKAPKAKKARSPKRAARARKAKPAKTGATKKPATRKSTKSKPKGSADA